MVHGRQSAGVSFAVADIYRPIISAYEWAYSANFVARRVSVLCVCVSNEYICSKARVCCSHKRRFIFGCHK